MLRCLELAGHGLGLVAPNPLVGAVLVVEDRVIGEGWHKQYGEAHAEVNCIASVRNEDRELIAHSTLYVSLEPCSHFGKTPPCTDLIIKYKIPKVVIGCQDPFKEVNGRGIEKLRSAGVEVELAAGSLAEECIKLNRRFFTFHQEQRPYIILKWAQTADGKMASLPSLHDDNGEQPDHSRLLISNDYSNRLVHKWRSEEAAIMVGTNTALLDDPELTNRLWNGSSPIRLVIDRDLRLPRTLNIFNDRQPTIVFNTIRHDLPENTTASLLIEKKGVWFHKIDPNGSFEKKIMDALFRMGIQSVLVEGGARLLQSFIDKDLWDESRIITNEEMLAGNALSAPFPVNGILSSSEKYLSDRVETYFPKKENHR